MKKRKIKRHLRIIQEEIVKLQKRLAVVEGWEDSRMWLKTPQRSISWPVAKIK